MSTAAGIALATAYALWGAFWWRVRGSRRDVAPIPLPASGQLVRLLCAGAMAGPMSFLDWRLGLLLWPALLLGMVLTGWGSAMDIGRVKGVRLEDTLLMCAWGCVAVAPAAVLLHWLGLVWWPLIAAGVAFGPIYALCWWLWDVEALPAPLGSWVRGPTEWAELGSGALICFALAGSMA